MVVVIILICLVTSTSCIAIGQKINKGRMAAREADALRPVVVSLLLCEVILGSVAVFAMITALVLVATWVVTWW